MKRTPLKRMGKVGRANTIANSMLRNIFSQKGIFGCEIRFSGCLGYFTAAFAHRHKRLWYKGDINKLADFKQVVRACVKCHDQIEHNAKLTEEVFMELRGEE